MSSSLVNYFTPQTQIGIQKALDSASEIAYQEIYSTVFVAFGTALPSTSRFWSNTTLASIWQYPQSLPIDKYKNFKVFNIRLSSNCIASTLTDQAASVIRDSGFLLVSRQSKAYPPISLAGLFNSTLEYNGATPTLVPRQQWGLNIASVDKSFVLRGDEDWTFDLQLPATVTTGVTGLFPTLPFPPSGITNGVYFKLVLTGQIERPLV